MAKPVILTVDDDPEVLQVVARDLRQQYGDRFRIIRADSGASAIDAVQQLKLRNESSCVVFGRSTNAKDVGR
jgi:thioredoxin reductase (NADPH)